MEILELELEFIIGLFIAIISGAIGLIIRRLFDTYTKKEVNDIIEPLRRRHDVKSTPQNSEDT